ncbi:MAG: alpha/beta hydrolase-fold protein [Candidatus Sumerlaeota bacterium]|nr:alpha/beta hydrolase-fold protein [Candidatus Sumerlaeota bacterium]
MTRLNRNSGMLLLGAMALLVGAMALGCAATRTKQQPAATNAPPPRVASEIYPDRTVTMRLRAPKALEVSVAGQIGARPMVKDSEGVWSVTLGPLAPAIYDYSFVVDGVSMADPGNPDIKGPTSSLLPIPAKKPALYEMRNVPHGQVTIHWYHSTTLAADRRVYVYTPPGYGRRNAKFPVLYLLHGSGDTESGWTMIGRANQIMDNLLAQRKAKPAIIVMPLGHVPPPAQTTSDTAIERGRSLRLFEADLLNDVIPLVEAKYRVIADSDHRAIAGLSMGGAQAASIGLNHPELFGYVGVWSAGLAREPDTAYKRLIDNAETSRKNLKLLWIGCGQQDKGFARAEDLTKWMTEHGVKNTWRPSEGAHEWPVWRMYLGEFLSLLF